MKEQVQTEATRIRCSPSEEVIGHSHRLICVGSILDNTWDKAALLVYVNEQKPEDDKTKAEKITLVCSRALHTFDLRLRHFLRSTKFARLRRGRVIFLAPTCPRESSMSSASCTTACDREDLSFVAVAATLRVSIPISS